MTLHAITSVGQPHAGGHPRRWRLVDPRRLRVGQLVKFEAPRFEPDGSFRTIEVISGVAGVETLYRPGKDGTRVRTEIGIVCLLEPDQKIAAA